MGNVTVGYAEVTRTRQNMTTIRRYVTPPLRQAQGRRFRGALLAGRLPGSGQCWGQCLSWGYCSTGVRGGQCTPFSPWQPWRKQLRHLQLYRGDSRRHCSRTVLRRGAGDHRTLALPRLELQNLVLHRLPDTEDAGEEGTAIFVSSWRKKPSLKERGQALLRALKKRGQALFRTLIEGGEALFRALLNRVRR